MPKREYPTSEYSARMRQGIGHDLRMIMTQLDELKTELRARTAGLLDTSVQAPSDRRPSEQRQ
jgi:hypothetical protein